MTMVFDSLRDDLGLGINNALPLPMAHIDGGPQAWQTTLVESNEFRADQMSSKTERGCCCIVKNSCRAVITTMAVSS
jgi:hypothetical protein